MLSITPFVTRRLVHRGDMVDELEGEMNRMMDSVFGRTRREMSFIPSMDVLEEKDAYVVKLEAPGMTKDDIEISMEDGVLFVRGEKKLETVDEKEGKYHVIERRSGKFYRSVVLPQAVEVGGIGAEFKDGVLTVKLPKKPEAKPHKIQIK